MLLVNFVLDVSAETFPKDLSGRGEAAKERVMLALHIAGSKLQLVQTRISRMHEPSAKNSNQ